MPQFTYSATDTAGNVIEGMVAANDMMVAADQVRRMGYTPVRVEVTNEQGATVPARSLTAGYSEQSQSQYLNAEYQSPEHLNARIPERRAAPLDLTQAFAETEQGQDVYNSLLAPPLEMEMANGQTAVTQERYLEPWERSVGATAPVTGQEIAAEANTLETAPALDVTLVTTNANAMHVGMNAQTVGSAQGRVGVRIPYAPGVETEKTLRQRFLETIVYPVFSGVVIKELAPFLRQFATLIDAGLPLYQALVALENNTPNQKLKEVAREGQRQVQAGGRFSDVMAAYPWIFQPMQIAMIRAAEQGGLLDQVLRQVADYIEHEMEIRRLISHETLYPKITLFVALMILGRPGFMTGTPAVSSLVLGSMGKSLYTFSNYLGDTLGFGLLIAIPFVAAVIICRLFLFNMPGVRESYDSLKMAIPSVGKITQMFATAKFARTYAALYRGGFTAASALTIAGDASGNGVIRRAALNAIPVAEKGGLVSDALARSNALPGMALDMFRTGETTGALDQMMDRIADFYEAEGKQKSHQAAMILGVVVFLLVALLVANSIIQQYTSLGTASTTLPDDGK
jgi:type IV pilus assembly protein PilC